MPKILLTEDDPLTMHVLQSFLQSQKFDVVPALDGAEAMGLLENDSFDIVISDIQMKPMDGLTFLRSVRDKGNNMPFIIMTAHPRIESYIQAVHKLGAFEYIQKPLDLDILMVAIKRLLKDAESAASS